MGKVLFTAHVDQHLKHFHEPFLKWFKDNNYTVHTASNGNEEVNYVDHKFDVNFSRNPFSIDNITALVQLKNIIQNNDYEIIHCHTPVGGLITRIAAFMFSKNTKVIYTAHGFHFFVGAKKYYWILFYPIEKLLSYFTDTLITINEEDFLIASKKFKAKSVIKVNGVGVNLKKFSVINKEEKMNIKNKMGFDNNDFLLIYVAELSKRKNQEFLIKAFQKLLEIDSTIKLLLVGKGESESEIKRYIIENEMENNIFLMGYRRDINILMNISDVAVSSSKQEGLPVNILEAMACGLPVIASDCRGNKDLIENKKNGYTFNLDSKNEFIEKVVQLKNDKTIREKMSRSNLLVIQRYSTDSIVNKMSTVYKS